VTQYLNNDGHPYSIKACLYKEKLVFLFTVAYIPVTAKTLDYRFMEMATALKIKSNLKLDKNFVTALY